jgi:hypothetical protein
MDRTASLAELLDHEPDVEPHEAVAIVQQLIHCDVDCGHPAGSADVAPGPLSIDRVRLEADGSAVCIGSDATPAVSEAANLLQRILPRGGTQVPGGLRYTIARALLDVEAPPFDSLEDFSRALARFERGDRREVVRTLLERAALASGVTALSRRPVPLFGARAGEGVAADVDPTAPSPSDRRVPTVTVTELRRQLREADQRLFVQRSAAQPRIEMRSTIGLGRRVPAIAAGVLVGLSLIGAGEAMRLRRATAPAVVTSGAPVAAPASTVSEPASQATIPPDVPKSIDRPQPRARRPPTTVAHRHVSKSARAVVTGSSSARTHDRGRQTDSPGIFNRIKFKWVDDISPRRE